MNSPEGSCNPEAPFTKEYFTAVILELSDALEELRHALKNYAQGSIVSGVGELFPNEMNRAARAVEAANGIPVEGVLMTNEYFVANTDVYIKGRLPHRHPIPNHFEAVIRGLGEVPTPRAGKGVLRLCVAVDPLYTLHDEKLSNYYGTHGGPSQLSHPFDLKENQDQRLYIPVDSVDPRGLKIVDEWQPLSGQGG